MKKMSEKILLADNVRIGGMAARLAEIDGGMAVITKLLAEANTRGSSDLVTASGKIKSDLSSASKSVGELLAGLDAQIVGETTQFDSGLAAAPTAGRDSVRRSLETMSEGLSDSKKN